MCAKEKEKVMDRLLKEVLSTKDVSMDKSGKPGKIASKKIKRRH